MTTWLNNNKGLITLLIGPLTGLLVSTGWVDATKASSVQSELNLLAGTIVSLVSILGALEHDVQVKKINAGITVQQNSTNPPVSTIPIS